VIIQPPAILVQGEVGSGKTWLISTLAEAGLECFVLVTEPTGVESLLDVWQKKKLDINLLHYHQVTPARIGFAGLTLQAENVSKNTFEGLAKMSPQGNRQTAQWLEVLKTFTNFKCDRTGKDYGAIDDFDDAKAVIGDSLSGLNVMAMDITIGDKTSAHVGEWGVAMGLIEKLILNLTSNLRCTFVLNAHLEREADELTGATKVMTSTLGKKLAPRIPRFFSEVVTAKRTDKGYVIDTADTQIITKTRSLASSPSLPFTLEPVIAAYRSRKEYASGSA
jgi:hypothetical protein